MRRPILILNLVLLVLAGLATYLLRVEWRNYRNRVNWVYQTRSAGAAEKFAIGTPGLAVANWSDIVARNVFHPDRNSLTAVAASGPPPPEPILFGTMDLGSGPLALMSEAQGRGYRQVHIGEPIGGYKLVAVEGQNVSLEWAGGQIKLDAAESASRASASTAQAPSAAPPPAPAAGRTAGASPVVSPAASSPASTGGGVLSRYPGLRTVLTPEQAADLDREPIGTIRNGKRKQMMASPFGVQIYWEDVKPGEEKK